MGEEGREGGFGRGGRERKGQKGGGGPARSDVSRIGSGAGEASGRFLAGGEAAEAIPALLLHEEAPPPLASPSGPRPDGRLGSRIRLS